MHIVPSSESRKIVASPTTTIWEFAMEDTSISGAVTEIKNRYPEKGYAVNEVSKELAFIVSGDGYIVTPNKKRPIRVGDLVFLDKCEQFAWEGALTRFMATTPKFDPKQHKIV